MQVTASAHLNRIQDKKFPFKLSSQEAYQRHYFKHALFHKAPLSAIINRKRFLEAGSFTGKRMLGDFEMWHILSQSYPVVLMPQGIVWYREHDEQEMSLHRADPMQPFKYLLLIKKLLNHDLCPLDKDQLPLALKSLDHQIARATLSSLKTKLFKAPLTQKISRAAKSQ